MDFPSIHSVFLTDPKAKETAAFFKTLKTGAHWPGELEFYPGAIECCRILFESSATEQYFIGHGCDRNGVVIKDSEGNALLIKSFAGTIEEIEASNDTGLRSPTIWVLRSSPNLVSTYIHFLKYRFIMLYGTATLLLVALNFFLRNTDGRPLAILLLAVSTMVLAACAIGAYAP